jgi:ribosome-binding factor A
VADSARARKVADHIQRIIAERLQRGVRDPRMGYATITDVKVTGDLQHATVFYTVLGSDEERANTQEAFKAATGMFRTEVGKHLKIRLTPSLEFVPDALPETSEDIERLLVEARERDEQTRRAAASATYAGDNNPYQSDAPSQTADN